MSAPRAPSGSPLHPCRYLEEGGYCAYWDMQLRGDEDIKCFPRGHECYEEPGGIFYEGRWLQCEPIYSWDSGEKRLMGFAGDAIDHYASQGVSEYTWAECQIEMRKPYWIDLLAKMKSQIVEPTRDT